MQYFNIAKFIKTVNTVTTFTGDSGGITFSYNCMKKNQKTKDILEKCINRIKNNLFVSFSLRSTQVIYCMHFRKLEEYFAVLLAVLQL